MKLISICIASGRSECIARLIDSINISDCPYGVEVNIVSINQQDTDLPSNVRWFILPRGGCNEAFIYAGKQATGDYITLWPDDWLFAPNWWNIVDFVEGLPSERKNRIAGYTSWGTPKQSAVWLAKRETIYNDLFKGTVFNPVYYHHFVDGDTSLMLWAEGEEFAVCPGVEPIITREEFNRDSKYHGQVTRYGRLDNMIFNGIWTNITNQQLFSHTDRSDAELIPLAEKSISQSRYYPKNGVPKITLQGYYYP